MSESGEQIKAEKIAALEAVMSEYEKGLLRYVSRIVSDDDAAQDVVQDTFIRLYRTWRDAMRPCTELSSWLYRVAHNCAIDHLRRERRRNLLHQRHAAQHPDHVAPDRGDGFRVSEAAEAAGEALRRLSAREQQLVILKVYEEKSYKEISEITGLSVTNVGFILHCAMKKLAAALKKAKGL